MTRDQLAEIEARADCATPGPWGEKHEDPVLARNDFGEAEITPDILQSCNCCDSIFGCNVLDLDFIAHAREDVPALVAEVKRLKEEVERLSEEAGEREWE